MTDLFAGLCVNRWAFYDDERGENMLESALAYHYIFGVDYLYNPVLLPNGDIQVFSKNNQTIQCVLANDSTFTLSGALARVYWNANDGLVLPETETRVVMSQNHFKFSQTTGEVTKFAKQSQYTWGRVSGKVSQLLVAQDIYLMDFLHCPLEYCWVKVNHVDCHKRFWRRYRKEKDRVNPGL